MHGEYYPCAIKMNVLLLPVGALLVFFMYGCLSSDIQCRKTVYVSKAKGSNRSASCGSLRFPCKKLEDGLFNLCWNGALYIDGQGTKKNPYSCEKYRELKIMKSFLAESYNEKPAYISCKSGIEFNTLEGALTNVTIVGLTFTQTNINLVDTAAVFNNCVFMESSPAINVKVSRKNIHYHLNVYNSVFQENAGCIYVNSRKCNTAVIVNLNNVVFLENTFLACGLVEIHGSLSVSCKYSPVMITWNNVVARKNSKVKEFVSRRSCRRQSKYPIHDSLIVTSGNIIKVSFFNVKSENNTRMRFLGILCRQSITYMLNSSYHGHDINDKGGVLYMAATQKGKTAINVTLINSNFSSNIASKGAVLSIQKGHQRSVNLKMSRIKVTNSYGRKQGCVFFVEYIHRIHATIDGVTMLNCHDPCGRTKCPKRYAGFCIHSVCDIRLQIKNSLFFQNFNGSVIFIKHKAQESPKRRGTVDISLYNSRFDKNHVSELSRDAAVTIVVSKTLKVIQKAFLKIIDSSFDANNGGIQAANIKQIKIYNTTFKHNKEFCVKANYNTNGEFDYQNSSMLIHNSYFTGNERPIYFDNKHPAVVDIRLSNLLFYKNKCKQLISLCLGSVRKKRIFTSGKIELDNVRIISNLLINSGGYLMGVVASHRGNVTLTIRRSQVSHNYQKPGISKTIKSLLFFYMPEDVQKYPHICTGFPEFRYNNTIFLEDVHFQNNTGSLSMLYLSSGNTTFSTCSFIDNFSRHPTIGAHLYVEDQGSASLKIQNSSFVQNRSKLKGTLHGEKLMQFVYAGAKGPLEISDSSFEFNALTRIKSPLFTIQYGGFVSFDRNTDLFCPYGSLMSFENLSRILQPNFIGDNCNSNITRLKFTCEMCVEGTYSLQRGSFHGSTLKQTLTNCLPCPFGANCSWKIQTTVNFWGYLVSHQKPELNFSRCPHQYCKVPTQPSMYNGCYGNRTGTMCGACRDGFTESMFNRKCRLINECHNEWFWIVTGICAGVMAIYFIFTPKISHILVNKIFWFRKYIHLIPPNSRLENDRSKKHGSGFSKMIFYFYQVAELLMLEHRYEFLHKSYFLTSVISFFNFGIEHFDSSMGCPFPGLTAVTKVLFQSFQVFAAMAAVIAIYLMYWFICLVMRRVRPCFATYIAAIIQILLLGYERLGHTSLELLNCTPLTIDGQTQWRLFLDGNITCWIHWWQYALIAYNIVFVVPFLFVLFVGTSKLQRQEISSLQFVVSCFFPLPFLVYWLFQWCRKGSQTHSKVGFASYRDQAAIEALLEIIEGPFRSSNGCNISLYWESILIGRRLVFLCLFSFVSIPLLRMFLMTLLCVAILMHNVSTMPYKEMKANILALVLLFCHVIMATTSFCKSVFDTDGVLPKHPTKKWIDGLSFLNFILLAAPLCAFSLLVAMAVISQMAQLVFLLTSALYNSVCPYKCGSEAPLEFIGDRDDSNDNITQPLLS